MNRHVTDFECTTDEPVAVWLWYDYNIDTGKYTKGYDIESFIKFVEQHPKHDFYFHNLAYDGSFIYNYLLKVRGIEHNATDYPTFKPTIQGKIDDFTYIFDFDKWVNFFDTMAILTGSLANFAKSVGLEKGDTSKDAMYTNDEIPKLTKEQWSRAEKYCKLDVEILARVCEKYHLFELMQIRRTKASLAYAGIIEQRLVADKYVFRPNYTPKRPIETSNEANVQEVDCVVYCSTKEYIKDKPQEKVTTLEDYSTWHPNKIRGNVVLRHERQMYDFDKEKYYNRKFETEIYYLDKEYLFYENPGKPYRLKYSKNKYGDELYEETKDVNMTKINLYNKAIVNAYKGGINYVNPKYQNIWLDEDVYVYDINSMYPWIYSTMRMPDIRTIRKVGRLGKDDLGFVMIDKIKARIKPNKMPLIKLKTGIHHANSSHYLDELNINMVFVLTNLEYQYMIENYVIEEIGNISFLKADENKELQTAFNKFCDYWYEEKKLGRKNKDITREWFAKLMLNSLYGKFGQFESQYQNYHFVVNDTLEKADISNYIDSMWDADLAVASYITAYGRVKLANDINTVGLDRFCYCDTDSLHVIGEAKELDVGLELGQWKLEGISRRSKFIQPKTYGELIEDEWHSVCAGFTDTIPIEEFESGMRVMVKRAVMVDGGYQIQDKWLILGNNVARDYSNAYDLEELDRLGL